MTIKTIVELQAKPGHRDELLQSLNEVFAGMQKASGFISASRYEVIDNPDSLIEITEWESPEHRQAWIEKSMVTGSLNRLVGKLSIPFKAITIRELK